MQRYDFHFFLCTSSPPKYYFVPSMHPSSFKFINSTTDKVHLYTKGWWLEEGLLTLNNDDSTTNTEICKFNPLFNRYLEWGSTHTKTYISEHHHRHCAKLKYIHKIIFLWNKKGKHKIGLMKTTIGFGVYVDTCLIVYKVYDMMEKWTEKGF